MQAYVGQHYSNVVATWGVPDSEIDNGEGGNLLTRQFVTTHTTPASVTTTTTHNTNSSSHTHANTPDRSHAAQHHHATTQFGISQQGTKRSHEYVNTSGNQVSTTLIYPSPPAPIPTPVHFIPTQRALFTTLLGKASIQDINDSIG
ncbi:MAG: hypothetical protein ABF330_07065 [Lentimonas sp.]